MSIQETAPGELAGSRKGIGKDKQINSTKFAKPFQFELKVCLCCLAHYRAAEAQRVCPACLHWSLIAASSCGISSLHKRAAA